MCLGRKSKRSKIKRANTKTIERLTTAENDLLAEIESLMAQILKLDKIINENRTKNKPVAVKALKRKRELESSIESKESLLAKLQSEKLSLERANTFLTINLKDLKRSKKRNSKAEIEMRELTEQTNEVNSLLANTSTYNPSLTENEYEIEINRISNDSD